LADLKISVVTAVYNRHKTVGQAIDSVLLQSHPAVESIVIDGSSTDCKHAVLEPNRTRLGNLIS
jgi:glycosyltransferase